MCQARSHHTAVHPIAVAITITALNTSCASHRPASFDHLLCALLQHIQDAIQQVNNGLSPTGTTYVGSTGVAYLFWHLSRHVAHGSLQIPRHLILLPAPRDPESLASTRCATPVELTQVALALCNAAIEATARHAESRCTFLEGFAGPLSLKCAILAGVGRHEVRENLPAGDARGHLCAHARSHALSTLQSAPSGRVL